MNTKVEQVVRAILSAPEEIRDTEREANEFYFRFRGHVFSIQERDTSENTFSRRMEYWFYVYPNWSQTPQTLAYVESRTDQDVESISYGADDVDQQLLRQLHKEAMSRCYNVDAVFDDILGKTGV
jgi:hypothetical protein